MPRIYSAKQVVNVLCRDFGFSFVSQKGSHIKLRKVSRGKRITTIVPNHKELSPGTLRGVLNLAQVDEREFFNKRP